MDAFGQMFGHDGKEENFALFTAIERAVSAVEPKLKNMSGYPDRYFKPVSTALDYAAQLAISLPSPVNIDHESLAADASMHPLLLSADHIRDAFGASHSLRSYQREFSGCSEMYALMGMRRCAKKIEGIDLSGQMMLRDVVHKPGYFTSHTIDIPAPNEQLARKRIAMSFFDSLVGKVTNRIGLRKHDLRSLMQEQEMLRDILREVDERNRPELEKEMYRMSGSMQSLSDSLELHHYADDFDAVLLHPEEYLYLDNRPVNMGTRRGGDEASGGEPIMVSDLIGYDRRDWTVTMVHCSNFHPALFAAGANHAHRRLAI